MSAAETARKHHRAPGTPISRHFSTHTRLHAQREGEQADMSTWERLVAVRGGGDVESPAACK